jgi:hypothetical protein
MLKSARYDVPAAGGSQTEEEVAMRNGCPGALVSAALALLSIPSYAGPCSPKIDQMQARVDALIASTAASGTTGDESVAASAHRQPTPSSIAAAEQKLGEGTSAERALAAMAIAARPTRLGMPTLASGRSLTCNASSIGRIVEPPWPSGLQSAREIGLPFLSRPLLVAQI